jgi:hypothetical protein
MTGNIHFKDNPAIFLATQLSSKRPVAFRPCLKTSLALSVFKNGSQPVIYDASLKPLLQKEKQTSNFLGLLYGLGRT